MKPGGVRTNLNPSIENADPFVFAKSSLSKVGYETESNGYWVHCLFMRLCNSALFGTIIYKASVKRISKVTELFTDPAS